MNNWVSPSFLLNKYELPLKLVGNEMSMVHTKSESLSGREAFVCSVWGTETGSQFLEATPLG